MCEIRFIPKSRCFQSVFFQKNLRLGISLLFASLLQGCFLGVGVMTTSKMETVKFPNPVIDVSKLHIGEEDKDFRPASSEKLLQYWGKPDKILELGNGSEQWVYNGASIETGALIVLAIIPIPLFTDDGNEQIIFTIDHGMVVAASIVDTKPGGFYCGLMLVHGYGFMCGAGSPDKVELEIPSSFQPFSKCSNIINDRLAPCSHQ